MVGAPDVAQPWMPRAARDSDAWLCHVSIAGGARRRGCAAAGVPGFFNGPLVHPRGAAAGEQAGHRGDAATHDEARHGRADDHLALVRAQLAAPVRGPDDLAAQLLHRDPELGAVGLDRAADLLRGALLRGAHRRASCGIAGSGACTAPGGPSGVAGCGAVSVALISCASSIAICGGGGEPFLKKPIAKKPAMPPSTNKTPATIR